MATDLDPAQLLARRPSEYLKDGFRDARGAPRPELAGLDAFAVATQFAAAEASPDEVAATYEALRQVLEAAPPGDPAARFAAAVQDALDLVERLLGVTNNIAVAGWLRACRPFVKTDADVAAFLEHFQAVLRQYSALISVSQPPETPPPTPPGP
jgi:hypothetical protein